MKKIPVFAIFCFVILWITACSSNDSGSSDEASQNSANSSSEIGVEMKEEMDHSSEEQATEDAAKNTAEQSEVESEVTQTDRMIIHQAQLHVEVKSVEQARGNIEKKVNAYGGYIVEANVYRGQDDEVSGHMTVRIPEKHFQAFLNDAEEEAAEVLERSVTGQDVTEQYVDLESRLKSKRAVEERLLELMEGAEKTEDLLKISSELADVQEEIEVIVGKMNYLENQTDYSTVNIELYENQVKIPNVDGEKLDTWEKTKKQLATSSNFILAAGSGLIIFIVGNLPVILIVLLIGAGVIVFVKRKKKGDK
ncbi:DUF4349 domain-containing protein [Virgibacillus sp. W0181]|uniref:DUF4349 domain-containing protein n=1 Tax=Virgibacillus sp. W0181 TaxID=3391581 RepID=UPI003F48E9AB